MEMKSFRVAAAIFLLFLLLVAPCISSRGLADVAETTEVYEIDYRGPETHSSIPPPGHSRGWPWIHGESAKSRGHNNGKRAKKIHG